MCVVECDDAALYKQRTKDEVASWLQEVSALPHAQWLVVQYTPQPLKPKGGMSMKLSLRDSVITRLRNDFGGKTATDRCRQVKGGVGGAGAADDRPDLWEGLVKSLERQAVLSLEDRLARCLKAERVVVANPMFHGKACSDSAFRECVGAIPGHSRVRPSSTPYGAPSIPAGMSTNAPAYRPPPLGPDSFPLTMLAISHIDRAALSSSKRVWRSSMSPFACGERPWPSTTSCRASLSCG